MGFDGTTLKEVVDLPYSTSKPLTIIDGIQYPLYFMPLKETYKTATYEKMNVTGAGETYGGAISGKILRFINLTLMLVVIIMLLKINVYYYH